MVAQHHAGVGHCPNGARFEPAGRQPARCARSAPKDLSGGRRSPAPAQRRARMRTYITLDVEGVTTITALDQVMHGAPEFASTRTLLTGEINAAIEGALAA